MAQLMTEAEPATSDDLQILPDPPSRRSSGVRWLWVLLPWSWFVIRGLHPWFELVAILLPILIGSAVGAAVLMLAYRRDMVFLALGLSFAAFFVVSVILPGRPIGSTALEQSTRFASVNVAQQWFTDNEIGFFVFDREPDVFVGVELRETHDVELRRRYENGFSDLAGFDPNPPAPAGTPDLQATYRRNDFPSIGIYSDHEMTRLADPIADQVDGGLPGFRVLVATDHGDLVVYALHVPRPGSGSGIFEVDLLAQNEILSAISGAIAAEELPVVVLGDLNIVDRGPAFGEFSSGFTDAMRVDRWAGPTRKRDLWHTMLQLRIDHLLIGEGLCASAADAPDVLFTDHTPIQADVGPCPAT